MQIFFYDNIWLQQGH